MVPVKIKIVPDRMAARDDEPSELDVLIDIESTAEQSNTSYPVGPMSLAISLDRSGSMGGEKIIKAKKTIKDIIKKLKTDDKIAIIVFDDEAEIVSAIESSHEQALNAVDPVDTRGSTNIILGWYLAVLELQKTNTGIKHIIILSDGNANSGITKVTEVRSEAAKAADIGITTSTVGIGADCDQNFLENLAFGSGGRFLYAENDDLDEILEEEFGTSQAIIVPRPFLKLEIPTGVSIVNEFHSLRRVADRLRMPPISLGEKQGVAFRLRCDPNEISGTHISIAAHIYAGQALILSDTISIPVVPFSDYVEAETAPLVGAFVQSYLSRKTDEKFEEAADQGNFALAQTIVLNEINGLISARDRLDMSVDREMYEHDRISIETSVKRLTFVINDLQVLFSDKRVSASRRQRFDDVYVFVRKLFKSGMSRSSSRRRLASHDIKHLLNALEQVRTIVLELENAKIFDRSLQQYMDAIDESLEDISRIDMGRH